MVGDQIGTLDLAEVSLDLLEHLHAARVALVASRRLGILGLRFRILQDERIVIDAQKTTTAGIGAAAANANEAGQVETGGSDLLRDVRTERGKFNAAHGQVTVMQQERRPWM